MSSSVNSSRAMALILNKIAANNLEEMGLASTEALQKILNCFGENPKFQQVMKDAMFTLSANTPEEREFADVLGDFVYSKKEEEKVEEKVEEKEEIIEETTIQVTRTRKLKTKTSKKNPEACPNSWMFFLQERRAGYVKEHPDLNSRSVLRNLGEIWGNMSEKEKAPYKKMAEDRKKEVQKSKN